MWVNALYFTFDLTVCEGVGDVAELHPALEIHGREANQPAHRRADPKCSGQVVLPLALPIHSIEDIQVACECIQPA